MFAFPYLLDTSATSGGFLFAKMAFLSATAELTQLLSNSHILLFIHKAKSDVFILKVAQNLGCHLQHGGQGRGGRGGGGVIGMRKGMAEIKRNLY